MILQAALTVALLTSPPHCQRATIMENSGNGPNYRVTICSALKPVDDGYWDLIVDGGPLQNGAVILGEKADPT